MSNNILYVRYDNESELLKSVNILTKKKGKNIIREIYSPYPIHNIGKLLDLEKNQLSFFSFLYGVFGFFISNLLVWYTMIFDWPQNIGGKLSYSWIKNFPSFIPVIFELSIFFSAHLMCITYLFQCQLFPGASAKNPDIRTTDNMFLIEINCKKNNIKDLIFLLNNHGAKEIKFKKS
ncbi:DUF3341 domain-containing protein [Blattabacterium cuenoti]|uniref:DUF3341 domain-containing protein n=1 Tax=Blattabacterium cuenoti TaxID=1653831 RepID=UPI00163D1D80|nr:DUF3341 domain-containing protein [Blattabacterium cuenoti]